MENRKIETDLNNILSLISCARTYGFEDDILFDAFADMINKSLSYEEIEYYAKSVLNDNQYSEDDYYQILERLHEFKIKYIP